LETIPLGGDLVYYWRGGTRTPEKFFHVLERNMFPSMATAIRKAHDALQIAVSDGVLDRVGHIPLYVYHIDQWVIGESMDTSALMPGTTGDLHIAIFGNRMYHVGVDGIIKAITPATRVSFRTTNGTSNAVRCETICTIMMYAPHHRISLDLALPHLLHAGNEDMVLALESHVCPSGDVHHV
jgi:hypothetical protein